MPTLKKLNKQMEKTDVDNLQDMLQGLYKTLGVLSYQIKLNKEQLSELTKSFNKTYADINECHLLLNQK